ALVFVGQETLPGALDALRKRIAALGEAPEVIYAGHTLAPASWLRVADISVSGSEFAGMPLGPLEAVGSGLRVVIAAIPGRSMRPASVARFPLTDKQQGAVKLAAHIEHLAGNGEAALVASWSEGASVRREFGVSGMVARYQSLYRETLRR